MRPSWSSWFQRSRKVKSSTDASIEVAPIRRSVEFRQSLSCMNGIDDKFYSTPDLEEGSARQVIIENAKVYPADDSKIGVTCRALLSSEQYRSIKAGTAND